MGQPTAIKTGAAGFLAALKASEFRGAIHQDLATRAVMATDNSIYELVPAAVVFPKVPEDLNVIATLASSFEVAITARGGGTGTNGQSLSESIIVDCSRYLNKILDINVEDGYAIVEPGVILDDLNRAAAPHDLFFAPTVSTASRATIGGMAATDASGKGSAIYGRTSDHVLAMDLVLSDGSDMQITADATAPDQTVRQRALCELVQEISTDHADEIARVFPKMNRGLTGYNLDEACTKGQVSLIKLFCGSEGTLALTKQLKVRLLPRPKLKALMVVGYDDTLEALADVRRLAKATPAAIEFIDDKILRLAQQDPVWTSISQVLSSSSDREMLGLNFVEVLAEDPAELDEKIQRITALDTEAPKAVIDAKLVQEEAVIASLWSLRKKCVGLLGRMDPTRQGTAFVEDAAVPPENLVAFVKGFRRILDQQGLAYGMFGHADVGCVHVRPALDMRQPEDAAQIRKVSDAVNQLAIEQGGLIWGEHGKGFRGEYGPDVFGKTLYGAVCRIKAEMDPGNILNPGKIAAPRPSDGLIPLDAPEFRGSKDATIASPLAEAYVSAIKCNGNGQCFGKDFDDAMCPSYKATSDRRYSPKGRAALFRSWMRAKAGASVQDIVQIEAELHDSLSVCLSCKACTSQCPVKVDIPKMRSQFYADYYRKHRRPLAHALYSVLEPAGPFMRRFPRLTNVAMTLAAPVLRSLGLLDLPSVKPSNRQQSKGAGQTVVLVEDSFLATFDGSVIDACDALLTQMGYRVLRSGFVATGKPLQVIGRLGAFKRTAQKAMKRLHKLEKQGFPLISIEPAFSTMFVHEFQKLGIALPEVQTIEAFLADHVKSSGAPVQPKVPRSDATPVALFSHCSEIASGNLAGQQWAEVFEAFGVAARPVQTGCCGMAGMFGHEQANQRMSRDAFNTSWAQKMTDFGDNAAATGFSCRCQAARFAGKSLPHPANALLQQMAVSPKS